MELKKVKIRIASDNKVYARIDCIVGSPAKYVSHKLKISAYPNKPDKYCVDISIKVSGIPRDPNKVYAAVCAGIRKEFDLGYLRSGKYVIRINNNNKKVHWFTV